MASESYHVSYHYPDQEASEVPYHAVQEHIFENDELALSVFRLQIRRLEPLPDGWFVSVLGAEPTIEHQEHFRRIFASGEAIELPEEVLEALRARREELNRMGPWIENHYGLAGRRLL